jgi:hypothetical protein
MDQAGRAPNAALAATPASNRLRSSFGIAGSLHPDIQRLLFADYARPHTQVLKVRQGH